ncbi:ABC transporter ATP-binding protein (plasmid) [Coraliomargarita sp. W4R53]
MSEQPIIAVENLNRTFRLSRSSHVQALKNVTCEVRSGTCLAVVGESGSGKSTLAKVIVGLETRDSGTVSIGGEEVQATTSRRELRKRARQVQMVFQDPQGSLNRSLPVRKTIDEMLRAHRPELNAAERRTETLALFNEVGLTARHADSLPSAISGGQKQRVAIARALAAQPKVIVLDEAVSALDVSVQAQVLDLLKRLREERGLSYLFITHDLSVVRDIADDVVVMRHGEIIERGSVDNILDRPQHPYTNLLIASAPRPGWKPQRGLRAQLLGEDTTTLPTVSA